MRVVETVEGFRKELDAARAHGQRVGLVPTMGALHDGHRSLVERSAAHNDFTAVTVFVNPLQFGPAEDLDRYPRDLEGDVATAAGAGAAMVFAPPVEEMFPAAVATTVHVGGLSDDLEGASRPGHFDGVATVVAKLFAIAGACRAYFGEKDYQQLLVVRRLAADLSLPVDVVGCPTVRGAGGLALSSRNALLSAPERGAATVLRRALRAGAAALTGGEGDASAVRAVMVDTVAGEPRATLDYAEVRDPVTLEPLARVSGAARLLVAAHVGGIRLIDNEGVQV